jgi:hypothetical protein
MTAEERLTAFLNKVDEYIDSKLISSRKVDDEIVKSDNLTVDELQELSQDDCFNNAYQLYQYADYISGERADQENALRWCDLSLNSILAQELDSQLIAKHEIKLAKVLLENELARKISEWKQHAEARLAKLTSREFNVRRKADILFEKGKRK